MPSFKCRIAQKDGLIRNRIVQAHDVAELKMKIESDGLMLISYRKSFEFRRAGKNNQLYIFTNQLRILIKSGAIMDDALEVIQQSTENDLLFSNVLMEVRKKIVRGVSLSDALAEHGDYFDPVYCNLIKAGERSGNLVDILEGLLEFQKKKVKLINRTYSIIAYPAVVILMVLSILIFLSLYIIPKFMAVFTELKVDVPPITKMVFAISTLISSNAFFLFPVFAAGALILLAVSRKSKKFLPDVFLRVPIISGFVKNYYLLVFSLSIKILLKGGVQLVDAIGLVSSGFPELLKKKLVLVQNGIMSGNSFTSLVAAEGIFPPIFTGLLKVGEKTGRLAEIFENAYEYYYDEFENSIELLTGLAEPIILVFLGLTIGTIVISLFVPLVSFMSQMR